MKHALALLALIPMAVQAAPEPNPGPFTVGKTSIGCQSVTDKWDLETYRVTNQPNNLRKLLENRSNPAFIGDGRHCTTIRAGTVVMVQKRYGSWDCVMPKSGADRCYYVDNVTKGSREKPNNIKDPYAIYLSED